jgi:hypothetical protein
MPKPGPRALGEIRPVFSDMASPPPSQLSGPSGPAGSGRLGAHGGGRAVGSRHPRCVSACRRWVRGRAVPSRQPPGGGAPGRVTGGIIHVSVGLAKCTALQWCPVAQMRRGLHCPGVL